MGDKTEKTAIAMIAQKTLVETSEVTATLVTMITMTKVIMKITILMATMVTAIGARRGTQKSCNSEWRRGW